MIPDKNGVYYTVRDRRNRVLMTCRVNKRGKMSHVFRRYADMTEEEKNAVRKLHAIVMKTGKATCPDGGNPSDIDSFLKFREERPCG